MGLGDAAVAEVDVAGLAVLEVAEEDGELAERLGYVSAQFLGRLFVDGLACGLLELEVARIRQAQRGIVGEC